MKAVGSGSDGGVHRVHGTWAAKNDQQKHKSLQGSLDSGLLPENHFWAPGIGRTVYFLDFIDFFNKKCVFRNYHFFRSTVLARTAFWGSLLTGLPRKFRNKHVLKK